MSPPEHEQARNEPTLLVDARNVVRSRWPNLDGALFIELLAELARRDRVRAIAVFDGRTPSGTTGVDTDDEHTTVVGTGGQSADDWIAAHAAEHTAAGELWLVSSDRELRRRVSPHVARTIGGGSFVRMLEALDRTSR